MTVAVAALFAPSAAQAVTTQGVIYSIDLVDDPLVEKRFHFESYDGELPFVFGEPQNKCPSGRGMNFYAKTIDFDTSYVEPAATVSGTDIWRKIYQGDAIIRGMR